MAAALASGCGGLTADQRMWLVEGQSAYDRKQYSLAVERLSTFLREAADQPEASRAYYIRGLSHLRLERRPRAMADLRQAVVTTSDADVRWRAYFELGSMQFDDEQWRPASRSYRSAADAMPHRPPLDTALYRIGVCLERLGQWSESRTYFERVGATFPRSRLAQTARRRIQAPPASFSIQCGAFSRAGNADKLQGRLSGAGLSAVVRSEMRGGRLLYVVYVGRYAAYETARKALPGVRAYVPEAVVRP